MNELLMMDDEELLQQIEDLQAEVGELYNEGSFDVVEKHNEVIGAMKEAKSRGYDSIEDLKESL
jgi:hypothetical protein